MLKPFNELAALDISGYISKKPTFKKVGNEFKKVGELDYLGWCDCDLLLHEHGAETVRYDNIPSESGHPVYTIEGRAPFIRVYVEIDGDRREITYPLIDGSKDIDPAKMEQSDVHNATQRAFVKCVALNWGLGLKLWQKEEREPPQNPKDDLSMHSAVMVKRRMEQLVTTLMTRGVDLGDVARAAGMKEKDFKNDLSGLARMHKAEAAIVEAYRDLLS